MNEVSNLPLGLMKQAIMKLESAATDIYEIREDPSMNARDLEIMEQISDTLQIIVASIMTMATREIPEEEFTQEQVDMDPIDPYPDPTDDVNSLMHEEI